MKSTSKILLVALFVVLGFYQKPFAQSTEVTRADIVKMEQAGMTLLRTVPNRSTMTSWVFPERREIVSIGEKNFQRFNDGPWQVLPPPPRAYDVWGDPSPTPSSKPRFENSVKLIETLNNKDGPVSVYETISKATREENGKDVVRISTNRFWFRYDGRLLRKDMELETVGEPRILKNSMVYDYENIKIEEPIVK